MYLSVENLRSIKQYVPTSEEIELVKEYDGDLSTLGNAKNYFREIMVIPHISKRLNCMIFWQRFEVEAQESFRGDALLKVKFAIVLFLSFVIYNFIISNLYKNSEIF